MAAIDDENNEQGDNEEHARVRYQTTVILSIDCLKVIRTSAFGTRGLHLLGARVQDRYRSR